MSVKTPPPHGTETHPSDKWGQENKMNKPDPIQLLMETHSLSSFHTKRQEIIPVQIVREHPPALEKSNIAIGL